MELYDDIYNGKDVHATKSLLPAGKITYVYVDEDGKIITLTAASGGGILWTKESEDPLRAGLLGAGIEIGFERQDNDILYKLETTYG